MRLAIIGGSGFIGKRVAEEARRRGDSVTVVGRRDCDLYDLVSLTHKLETIAPDALINAAGYSGRPNVDACESHKPECLTANAVLPGIIADACQSLSLPWGHISSGCIFNQTDQAKSQFTERDEPNFSFRNGPCSFYSGTKALGEEMLKDASQCYIWRLRIPFSNVDSSRNYLSKVMRYEKLLEAENSLSKLEEFTAAALDCFELNLPYGLYNLTNPGSVMTSDVVELIRQTVGSDLNFQFFDSEDDFMQKAAKAPRSNCVLDSSNAVNAGLKLTPVMDALRNSLHQWQPETASL